MVVGSGAAVAGHGIESVVEFGAIGAIGLGAIIVPEHGEHLMETTDRGALGAQTPTTDSGKLGTQTPRLAAPTRCASGGTNDRE